MTAPADSAPHLSNDDRRERIVELLHQQDEVSVERLSQHLSVSEVTVRKDLGVLEEQGYLTRVRGGAIFSGRGRLELRFAARQQMQLDEKRRIARRALRYVRAGATIFLDASTTVFQMVPFLRDFAGLTVITNGLYPAQELSFSAGVTTHVIGGTVRQRSSSLVDAAPDVVRRLHVDVAFLSGRGLTLKHGLTESDIRDAQMKQMMAQSADQRVALADHSKYGQAYVASSVLPAEITRLIMDSALPAEHAADIRAAGVELELV